MKTMELIDFVVIYILLILNRCNFSCTEEIDFVDSLLNVSVYNKNQRPGYLIGPPVEVDIDLFVSGMNSISEITMNYKLNMFLRQRWRDERLSFIGHPTLNHTITLNYNYINKMWQPDTFLKNEVNKGSLHDITVPNILLNLDPDGSILYSQRISTTLGCNMKLEKYPLDNQTCYIKMESYGYTTKDVILRWRDIKQPIQINNEMELPEFNLTSYETGECTVAYTTGAFSCIHASIHFKRLTSYYFIQVFVPTTLIVILSWISFWIDYRAVPARISVGLLTVLTVTTKSSSISSKLPKVSYIKAIDVWMFMCAVFVFAALIEYSMVNVLARKSNQKEEKQGKNTGEDRTTVCRRVREDKALLVDTVSRYLFPICFVVFNLGFWLIYQNMKR